MKAFREHEVALYRPDLSWFGLLDPNDNTIVALFYLRWDAERFQEQNELFTYELIKVRVDE